MWDGRLLEISACLLQLKHTVLWTEVLAAERLPCSRVRLGLFATVKSCALEGGLNDITALAPAPQVGPQSSKSVTMVRQVVLRVMARDSLRGRR